MPTRGGSWPTGCATRSASPSVPGTDELWIGDVGWNTWEEINRVVAPASATASNFGWPCYEGASPQGGYQGAGLNLCSSLYSTPGSVVAPYYTYNHSACVVNYTGCHTGGSSITGVAFYQGGSYPAQYNGALFFADHTRNEIWAMLPGTNGLPDPPGCSRSSASTRRAVPPGIPST